MKKIFYHKIKKNFPNIENHHETEVNQEETIKPYINPQPKILKKVEFRKLLSFPFSLSSFE